MKKIDHTLNYGRVGEDGVVKRVTTYENGRFMRKLGSTVFGGATIAGATRLDVASIITSPRVQVVESLSGNPQIDQEADAHFATHRLSPGDAIVITRKVGTRRAKNGDESAYIVFAKAKASSSVG